MSYIQDSKDWGREDVLELFKDFLLKSCPGPRFSLVSEQVKGGNDVGEVWDEISVKVCESNEQLDSLD